MISLEQFDIGQLIGKGGFATVYRAKHRESSCDIDGNGCDVGDNQFTNVAIKIANKQNISNLGQIHRIHEEITIHSKLNHPNIVYLIGHFEDDVNIYIVTDLCLGGNLFRYLKSKGRLNEQESRHVMYQILSGLLYLHTNGIVHRDLKLSNILLYNNPMVNEAVMIKICDFGLAAQFEHPDEEHFTICGTPNYIAPEIAKQRNSHGFPADMWSVGCLFYSMIVGTPPFEKGDFKVTIACILEGKYIEPQGLSTNGKHFMKGLLNQDPRQRPTVFEAIRHPFIHQIHPNNPPQPMDHPNTSTPPYSISRSLSHPKRSVTKSSISLMESILSEGTGGYSSSVSTISTNKFVHRPQLYDSFLYDANHAQPMQQQLHPNPSKHPSHHDHNTQRSHQNLQNSSYNSLHLHHHRQSDNPNSCSINSYLDDGNEASSPPIYHKQFTKQSMRFVPPTKKSTSSIVSQSSILSSSHSKKWWEKVREISECDPMMVHRPLSTLSQKASMVKQESSMPSTDHAAWCKYYRKISEHSNRVNPFVLFSTHQSSSTTPSSGTSSKKSIEVLLTSSTQDLMYCILTPPGPYDNMKNRAAKKRIGRRLLLRLDQPYRVWECELNEKHGQEVMKLIACHHEEGKDIQLQFNHDHTRDNCHLLIMNHSSSTDREYLLPKSNPTSSKIATMLPSYLEKYLKRMVTTLEGIISRVPRLILYLKSSSHPLPSEGKESRSSVQTDPASVSTDPASVATTVPTSPMVNTLDVTYTSSLTSGMYSHSSITSRMMKTSQSSVDCKCMLMSNYPLPDFFCQWSDGTRLKYSLQSGLLNIYRPRLANMDSMEWSGMIGDFNSQSDPEQRPTAAMCPSVLVEYIMISQKALQRCLHEERRDTSSMSCSVQNEAAPFKQLDSNRSIHRLCKYRSSDKAALSCERKEPKIIVVHSVDEMKVF